MAPPSARCTPPHLEPGDVVRIDGRLERVVRCRRVAGNRRWLIRTSDNLHLRRTRDRLDLVAMFVPGIGYVQPLTLELVDA